VYKGVHKGDTENNNKKIIIKGVFQVINSYPANVEYRVSSY
jgi:hypothetical protein